MSPKHSIDYCPICGGGLCGIRVCGLPAATTNQSDNVDATNAELHGLIVCDECEAIWLDPDTSTDHQYPSAEHAACPICSEPLWGVQSRWATIADVKLLRWNGAVNPELDFDSNEEIV